MSKFKCGDLIKATAKETNEQMIALIVSIRFFVEVDVIERPHYTLLILKSSIDLMSVGTVGFSALSNVRFFTYEKLK